MLDKLKNSKMTARFVSVIFAVAIWLALTYTVNPTITQTVKNVKISYIGESELAARGLAEDGNSRTQSVDVRIRGTRSAVINALATISAEVDLSDITSTGEKQRIVSIDTGISGVSVVGRTGPKVSVTIEELVEKQIPLRIVQTGVEKNKRLIAGSSAEEKSLKIRGAKSEVAKIAAASASVDISDMDGEITRRASVGYTDADGVKLVPVTLTDAVQEVEVTTKFYERASAAIKVVLPDEDGTDYALEVKALSKEKTDIGVEAGAEAPDTLYAVFAPERFREGQEEYSIKLKVPEGVYVPTDSESVTAKLSVEKTVEKLVNFAVTVKNVASGLKAECSVKNITLKARGAASEPTAGRTVCADAENLGVGSYELALSAGEDSGFVLSEDAYVSVTITPQ